MRRLCPSKLLRHSARPARRTRHDRRESLPGRAFAGRPSEADGKAKGDLRGIEPGDEARRRPFRTKSPTWRLARRRPFQRRHRPRYRPFRTDGAARCRARRGHRRGGKPDPRMAAQRYRAAAPRAAEIAASRMAPERKYRMRATPRPAPSPRNGPSANVAT